ncbi:precorrin-6Y C5,15-methyltransferase (decarboxylating) subunit CbiT [Clostridium formicaceticum]|uniref:Cobalt-precorrin-6Y C(15)-methyltransferase n=1 Tax=Clostridium formicaceticum TaxID=1497 RepID=A0AAC9RHR3_9CLOT|nr:precorrin-6Y C5,15-methyltransferase (decarboxylating) subunit CbiT [Clostridium formicaceticum]AOY75464.1 precorrin-6Y C5,15-methyltransferase (decarboxylating) subunit CbiT [Clostridium formicaceticum]ARE85749.1 putative cobalt-precorrin-6Y C(15)-methyltransferase [Clostridium formicaceticum]
MNKRWEYSGFGIPDDFFVRGKAPMTKEEVRAVVLSKLRLKEDHIFVDVGAGTGSVSIEAALKLSRGKVYAIEYKEEALSLLEVNAKAFGVENLEVLKGRAEEELKKIKGFDRIFVGGSGGEIHWILDYALEHLSKEGRIVITAVTLETLTEGFKALKKKEYKDVEVVSVGVSKGRSTGNYTLMEAQNNIYVLSATKN